MGGLIGVDVEIEPEDIEVPNPLAERDVTLPLPTTAP